MSVGKPLTNKTIVITRPKHQSAGVCAQLTALGAHVVEFPLLDIAEPLDGRVYKAQLDQLARYDYLIFTSRNAVHMAFAALQKRLPDASLATMLGNAQIAAVGQQTAASLEQQGVTVSIVPDTSFNSEALLDHVALKDVETKHIAIVRGEGGRDLLHRTLVQRGGLVDYIDVYRRICPVSNLLPLVKCQQQTGIDIIALTSVEGLTNLFALGAGEDWLNHVTLLVGSQRMADAVSGMGHQGRVIIAHDPSDDQMVNRLLSWAKIGN